MEKNILNAYRENNNLFQSEVDRLSMIGNEGVITGVSSWVKKTFMSLKDNFKIVSNKFSAIDKKSVSVQEKNLKKIGKNIKFEKITMGDLENKNIPCMLGQKSSLNETIDVIKTGYSEIEKVTPLLKEIDTMLANIISKNNERVTFTPKAMKWDDVYKMNEILEKGLERVIIPGNRNDTIKAVSLIHNVNSVKDIQKELLAISKDFNYEAIEEFSIYVSRINDRVDGVIMMLDNEELEITKNVLQEMAHSLRAVANVVTLSSTYLYMYNQTVDTFEALIHIMNDLENEK
jgi:hypothetical protein